MATALNKSPLARVKDDFGGKDKLVDKIVGVLDAGDESKDELRKRLLGVANRKLIRLHAVATETKQLGGHDKLAAVTADKLGRAKDKDYVAKLEDMSNGRLIDIMKAAENRAGAKAAASASASGDGAKRVRAARPAQAKVAENSAKKSAPVKPQATVKAQATAKAKAKAAAKKKSAKR